MVSMFDLWLPIVVSAVFVFAASSVIHMVLAYHQNDYGKLPDEEKILSALREAGVGPGDYRFPHAQTMKDMGSPEMQKKFEQGPVGLVTLFPSGPPAMGKALGQWFVFCLVIGVFAAYVAAVTLEAGTHYRTVFRVVGTAAFLGYAAAQCLDSIWKGQSWLTTLKHVFDGLVFALLTAGTFGWLWPR